MRPITIKTEAAMFRARAVSPPMPDGWTVKCRIYQVQVSTIQNATRWSLRFIGSRGQGVQMPTPPEVDVRERCRVPHATTSTKLCFTDLLSMRSSGGGCPVMGGRVRITAAQRLAPTGAHPPPNKRLLRSTLTPTFDRITANKHPMTALLNATPPP